MSRHVLPGKGVASSVVIGWDRPLGTFFVQVLQPHPRIDGEEWAFIWVGSAPGDLPSAAAAIEIAKPYADLPANLGVTLETDRLRTLGTADGPAQIAAKPFIAHATPVIRSEAAAREAGYTQAIIADCSLHTLELLIKPGTELDSTFIAYDRNAAEMIDVHGWNFSIEPE